MNVLDIKEELLISEIAAFVKNVVIDNLDIDISNIANTTAISALAEIQSVLKDSTLSDFEIVEYIVCIFGKYHLSCGVCHDF